MIDFVINALTFIALVILEVFIFYDMINAVRIFKQRPFTLWLLVSFVAFVLFYAIGFLYTTCYLLLTLDGVNIWSLIF